MSFASEDLKMGQLNALVKKIGGAEAARKILRGDVATLRLKPRVKKLATLSEIRHDQNRPYVLLQAIKEADVLVTPAAEDLFQHFDAGDVFYADLGSEMRLGVVTVEQLTGDIYASRPVFFGMLRYHDLMPCPFSVGPRLCLQLKDSPPNRYVDAMLAMVPVYYNGNRGYPKVFHIQANPDGDVRLGTYHCAPEQAFNDAPNWIVWPHESRR